MSGNLLLAAPGVSAVRSQAVGAVIFKVRDWDPNYHPRGYKGMFIETIDKKSAGDVATGAVIATKSGKVFQVTGHGAKGIKVQSVDPDTGAVQAKGTIVANGVEVAVFQDKTAPPTHRFNVGDPVSRPDGGPAVVSALLPGGMIQVITAAGGKLPYDANELELIPQTSPKLTPQIGGRGNIHAPGSKISIPKTPQAPGVGSTFQISQLVPGTFVKHPNSGKRFEVGKQGKWTTVYPVDSRGERTGKHTVLPPQTQMVVEDKVVASGGVGQVHTTAIQTANVTQAPQTRPPRRKSLRSGGGSVVDSKPPPELDVGDKIRRVSDGEEAVVKEVRFNGDVAVDWGDGGPLQVIDPREFEKIIPEILPTFDKPPRTYAPGTGRGTGIVIEEIPELSPYGGASKDVSYVVKRVPDPSTPNVPGEVIGTYNGIGAARKSARALSENHEAVVEVRAGVRDYKFKTGDWGIFDGYIRQVATVEEKQSYYGSNTYQAVTFTDNPAGRPVAIGADKNIAIPDFGALNKFAQDNHGSVLMSGLQVYLYGQSRIPGGDEILQTAIRQTTVDPKTVRAARPNLYVDALRTDFDPSELVGKPKGQVLAALRKAGYAEITPREPNMTKYVNNRGKRLHLHNKAGNITAIDEIKQPTFSSGGSGLTDFRAQLQQTLDGGGDVRPLNPQDDPSVEARTSHTRQIVFDMALGKQQGVEQIFQKGSSVLKVKSDAAYRSEIQKAITDGALPDLAPNVLASKVEDPGLNVPLRTEVMDKHFPDWKSQSGIAWTGNNLHIKDPSENEAIAVAAIASGERNGIAEWVAKEYGTDFRKALDGFAVDYAEWQKDPSSPNTAFGKLSQGQRDYITGTLKDVEPRATRQWELRRTEITRRIDSLLEQGIATETGKRRTAEGTVASVPGSSDTFELPLWDEIDFQSQDLGDVESLVQNAPSETQIVPFFFSGGLIDDSVLYAVKEKRGIRIDGRIPKHFDQLMEQRLVGARVGANPLFPNPIGSAGNRIDAGQALILNDGGGKRIEYVPHNLHRQTAVASQRGQLRMYGYTPEEAAARLKDLGIVHEIEGEVPYSSIMRSRRRYGRVLPLHSDYVSGDAPLPKIPAGIGHGMNSGNLTKVMDSGGLLPLAERFRVGIPLSGTIPRNDIAGGVDHVVFAAISGNYAGYGDVSVLYKDSAYLRRNVLITDRVFSGSGGGNGRYPSYRQYHNRHRMNAGIADADQNIYATMEPAARQSHINERYRDAGSPTSMGAGQNEWDLEGGVPIEDMAVIAVPDQRMANSLNRQLDQMLASGRISERPEVEVSTAYGGRPWKKAERKDWTVVDPRSIGKR